MPLTHLPSTRSIDLTGIRYIDWDKEESGKKQDGQLAVWRRTYIYYHNSPVPVTFNSDDPKYNEDVALIKELLGVPKD